MLSYNNNFKSFNLSINSVVKLSKSHKQTQWRIHDFPAGALTYYLGCFCRKLYENEKNGLEKGGRHSDLYHGSVNQNMFSLCSYDSI